MNRDILGSLDQVSSRDIVKRGRDKRQMTEILFYAVGGLALFLFGLVTLSEGLKKAASDQLRNILEKLYNQVNF